MKAQSKRKQRAETILRHAGMHINARALSVIGGLKDDPDCMAQLHDLSQACTIIWTLIRVVKAGK